jgi:tetratricopeptide (TPR) repeat protein
MKKNKQQKAVSPKSTRAVPRMPPPAPSFLPTQSLALLLLLLTLLAVVPYLNAFSNHFTLDDVPIIVENPIVRDLANAGKILTTNYWGEREEARDRGLYRPLTVLTYAMDYHFWQLNPKGYHVVNVVLHTTATLLLFLLALGFLGSSTGAFVAAAIFAVHPVHTEAVTSIVGRAELLAALFFLLGFWFSRRQGLSLLRPSRGPCAISARALAMWGGAALFYFLGLLAKETAVTLPALLLVYDLTYREDASHSPDKRKPGELSKTSLMLLRYAGLGIVLLIYSALRSNITVGRNMWIGFKGISADARVLTASRVLMEYLALLTFPRTLSADYWKPEVAIAHSPAEPLVLLSLLVWLALGIIAFVAWRRRARPLFLAQAWFFITILPVSNLLLAIGVGKAERILYLPSAGFCLFLGSLYGLAEKKVRKEWLLLPLLPILFLFAVRTYSRNADWKDNFTLALATLKVSPTSPTFNQIAASEYRKHGETDKAIPLLQNAIGQRPEEESYHYNLGNCYLDRKQYDMAIASYQEALRLKPGYMDALNNLGSAQMQAGKNADAIKTFTTILSISRGYVAAYLNLGTAYLNLGNLPEAARVFREGLALFPNNGGLHFNLAVILHQMGQAQEADQEYQKAIALDPALKKLR